jgi:hypothetical protein
MSALELTQRLAGISTHLRGGGLGGGVGVGVGAREGGSVGMSGCQDVQGWCGWVWG